MHEWLIKFKLFHILDATVAILVYDITRNSSFEETTSYWINQLKEHSGKNISRCLIYWLSSFIVIAVAANKSDKYEIEEVEEKIGRKFAKGINAIFKYSSAKKSHGIDVR